MICRRVRPAATNESMGGHIRRRGLLMINRWTAAFEVRLIDYWCRWSRHKHEHPGHPNTPDNLHLASEIWRVGHIIRWSTFRRQLIGCPIAHFMVSNGKMDLGRPDRSLCDDYMFGAFWSYPLTPFVQGKCSSLWLICTSIRWFSKW